MKPYLARTLSLIGILALYFPHAALSQDTDSDFLSDTEELAIGSDPYDTDTDGDGILDRHEVYPFKIVSGAFTYEAALADAAAKGGRLVVIDSLDKLYNVKRGLLTTPLPSPLPNAYDPAVTLPDPLWIGAQDILNDGQYQWADYGSTLANPLNLSELGSAVFGDLTPGSSTVSNVVNITALAVGRPFVASGVPAGTTITAINSAARTLTLSNPVASILSQGISRVVVSNTGYAYTSPPVVSFTGPRGVSSVSVTAGGSSYVNPPTVSFVGGTGSGATAIATVSGGAVTGVTITSRGSYTVAPTGVTFTPVGGGSGATATVSLGTGPTTAVALTAEGRIKSITVTGDGGTYYTAAPTVSITGGNGGGALATAVLTPAASGNVSAVTVTSAGTGYTTTPTVTITGGGGTGAVGVASINALNQVTGIAIINPGSGYTSAPTVTISGVGTGATATASIRQFAARASSPVSGSYVNWASDLLPGNRVNSKEGLFLSAGSVFTWETAQVSTTRGYLLELRPTSPVKADTDGDGLSDQVETNTGTFVSATDTGTNPTVADTDSDGLSDSAEVTPTAPRASTNPTKSDTDGDGLTDQVETNTGTYVSATNTGTNPTVVDTDGDGLTDSAEISPTAPRVATNPTKADTDGDGLSDQVETNTGTFVSATDTGTNPIVTDTDGDGFTDFAEVSPTAPRAATNPTKADTDGDGASDYDEIIIFSTNPNVANSSFPPPLPPPLSYVDFTNPMVNGNYEGLLLHPNQGPTTSLTLKVTSKRSFSGNMTGISGKTSLKGTFASNGTATVKIKYAGTVSYLYLVIAPDSVSGIYRVWANLSASPDMINPILGGELRRPIYGKSNPNPHAGSYTIVIPAPTTLTTGQPGGDGYLVGNLKSDGVATFTGLTSDGQTLKWSGNLLEGDKLSFFSSFASNKGFADGYLIIRDSSSTNGSAALADLDGDILVNRAFSTGASASYTFISSAYGSLYRNTPYNLIPEFSAYDVRADNSILVFSEGPYASQVAVTTWQTDNKLSLPATQTRTLSGSINSKNGELTATYKYNDSQANYTSSTARLKGVILQKSGEVRGSYNIGGGSSGRIALQPNEGGLVAPVNIITPKSKTIGPKGGSYNIYITSSELWDAIVSYDFSPYSTGNDWLTLSEDSGTGNGVITIEVAENTNYYPRSGKIKIAGITHTIKQNQAIYDPTGGGSGGGGGGNSGVVINPVSQIVDWPSSSYQVTVTGYDPDKSPNPALDFVSPVFWATVTYTPGENLPDGTPQGVATVFVSSYVFYQGPTRIAQLTIGGLPHTLTQLW